MNEMSEKKCSKCEITKPIDAFSRQRKPNGEEGRRSQCKECIKEYHQSHRKEANLRRQVDNLTAERHEELKRKKREYIRRRREINPDYFKRRQERTKAYFDKMRIDDPEKYSEIIQKGRRRANLRKY